MDWEEVLMSDVFFSKFMKQQAVYWEPDGTTEFGRRTFLTPVQIRCRWSDNQEDYVDKKGKIAKSSITVMVPIDVKREGYLLLLPKGSNLADVVTDLDAPPTNYTGSAEILGFDKVPNFKASKYVRYAYF